MKTSIRTFVLASNAAATLFQRIEQEDIKTMRDVFSEGHANRGADKSSRNRMSAKQSNGRIGCVEASHTDKEQPLPFLGSTRGSGTENSQSRRPARVFFVLLLLCLVWVAPAGVFAQKAVFMGAQSVFSNQLSWVVAVDKAGNVFTAGADGSIVKTPAGGGTPATVASNLGGSPISLAVDGADNLYVVIEVFGIEFDNIVLKVPAGRGSPVKIGGPGLPVGVAVDPAGDAFIAEAGEDIAEIPANGGPDFYIPSSVGLNPGGVAVDAKENLFVTDLNTGDVFELPFTSGSRITLGTGFSSPVGIAVDNAGNVFVADNGNNDVVEIPAAGGSQAVGTSLNAPVNVAVNAEGDLYIADTGNKRVVEEQLRFVSFGNANVCPQGQAGVAPCSQTLTLNLGLYPGVVGQPVTFTPRILTQGAQNQDFSLSSESCGLFRRLGYGCTLTVNFGPKFSGLREGAMQVTDSLGGAVALAVPLFGIGNGPQVAFNSSAQATVPASGLSSPVAVATDLAGDVFIVDTDNNRLVEVPAGGGAQFTVDDELSNPLGVAVDGAGDLFIADHGNDRVVEIPFGGGAWQTVGTGLAGPAGVAVDGAGDVFIADYANNQVVEVPSGGAPQMVVATAADGLSGPRGLAVDGFGNLFIASSENALVLEVPSIGPVSQVGTGLNAPYGVALDAAGDVYIADYGSNSVVEVSAGGQQSTLSSGLSIPTGVAADGAGDVYVADYGNARVVEVPRSEAPALSFAPTDVNSTSTDSPQTVIVQNIGNQALNLTGVSFPVDFPEGTGEELCSTSVSLIPGQGCNLPVNFTPLHVGSLTENLKITDNALNATGATQSITLAGTGLAATPAVLTSPTPNSTLTATAVKFTWSAGTGVSEYDLHLSAVSPGGYDLYVSGHITGTSKTVNGLPTNGEKIYARLYSIINGVTLYNDYTYTAASIAKLTSPAPNSTLTANSVKFTWSTGTAVSQYDLHLSAVAPGGYDLYLSGHIAGTSTTVNGLPTNGQTIYARLYTILNGVTLYNDYTYTAK